VISRRAARLHQGLRRGQGPAGHLDEVHHGPAQLDLAVRDARDVEEIVHQTGQVTGLAAQGLLYADARLVPAGQRLLHGQGGPDRAQRVAQLVGEHGQELVLATVRLRQRRRLRPQLGLRAARAEQRGERGHELDGLEGLHEVAVRAAVEAVRAARGRDVGGRGLEHRDGFRGRVRLEPAADLEAVHVRELHVQDDHVHVLAGAGETLLAGLRLHDVVAGLAQDPRRHVAGRLVVVDEEGHQGARGE
jgi:hypothetical protein